MLLREDILQPIAGDNPSGPSLRYEYDEIKEARREEEDLAQGEWQTERKVADFPKVLKLSSELLATRTKDLQLAFWISEALLKLEQFPGLIEGIRLNHKLLETFWDTIHPGAANEEEEGDPEDLEMRAAPLSQFGLSLAETVRFTPIVKEGFHLFDYKESRTLGYEDKVSKEEKKARDAKIAAGKVTPEEFDDAFDASPKAYYVSLEADLDESLESLAALEKFCDEKFGEDSPGFSSLRTALTEVRHQVHQFLEKKRELEPDPVEEEVVEGEEGEAEAGDGAGAGGAAVKKVGAASLVIPPGAGEPADRRDIVAAIANAAAALRKKNPTSPAPFLMLRGLRWGELREAAVAGDAAALQPPPVELRRRLKELALAGEWATLLEDCERTLALPYGRAWLDLQRFAVEACAGLGPDYYMVARAICGELVSLLREIPDIVQLTLLDETPVASLETRAWLRELSGGLTDQAPIDLRPLASQVAQAQAEPEPEPEEEPQEEPEVEQSASDEKTEGAEAGEAEASESAASDDAKPESADGGEEAEPAEEAAVKLAAPKKIAKKKPETPKPPPPARAASQPQRVAPPPFPKSAQPLEVDYAFAPGWRKKEAVDAFELAQRAVRAGKQQDAVNILWDDIPKQTSGRERFQRQLQLVEILVSMDKADIAQPLLDDLGAAVDRHQIDAWEDRELVVHALAVLYRHSESVKGDKKAPKEIYERVVRLDPVKALEL